MKSGGEVVRGRWEPDPLGRHEFRWRDETTWSGWVTDGLRQSFDAFGSAPGAIAAKAFDSRRHSIIRLAIGLAAILGGLAVTIFTAASEASVVEVVPIGVCIFGLVEVGRSLRFLVRGRQPLNVPTTPAPPRLDLRAELRALDARLHKGKLSQAAYELAAMKLRRKYNVAPPPGPRDLAD